MTKAGRFDFSTGFVVMDIFLSLDQTISQALAISTLFQRKVCLASRTGVEGAFPAASRLRRVIAFPPGINSARQRPDPRDAFPVKLQGDARAAHLIRAGTVENDLPV